ncbi:MAG: response regulator [Burkholderiales bacterium]|nr:MAG: response regulator [Burkholderiales bacterium]
MNVASGPSLGENPGTVKISDTLYSDLLDATPSRLDPAHGASGAATVATASDLSVLVVDDSRFVRASLVRGLTGRFRVQQAESGERAWELLLLDGSIGAILSDLSMPGIDGFELLRRVRGSLLERVRDLPFAMLSGSDDAAQRERALALGADRFVVKGDGVGELADWIAERLRAARESGEHGIAVPPAGATAAGIPTAPVASIAPVALGPDAAPDRSASPSAPDASRQSVSPIPPIPPVAPVQPIAPTSPNPSGHPPPRGSRAPVAEHEADLGAAIPVGSGTPAPSVPTAVRAQAQVARLVPDPVPRWFAAAAGRPVAAGEAAPALIRMHAPGLDDLPARLRRGVRAADALFVESVDTAWLCVPASAATALRLSMRFALLAAGRHAHAPGGTAARVSMCMHPVDPLKPGDALAGLLASPPEPTGAGGLTVRAFAGAWGPAWQCTLPWPAVRLLAA